MPSDSSSFSIHPAVLADVPALATISGLSFETDTHTLLKAAHPTKPYDHAAGMHGAFEYWLSLPKDKIDLVKAVDDETGEILGFVGWGCRLEKTEQSTSQQSKDSTSDKSTTTTTSTTTKKPSTVVTQDDTKAEEPPQDALAQLNELTSSHLANYQNTVMPPGTRCMYIVSISVHPKHQGRNIGTALIKHGTDRADAEGVFCWVHSSEAGAAMFGKCGFKVDDTLEIDLDSWARKMNIDPPAGRSQWGTYTFRYMIRQPITG